MIPKASEVWGRITESDSAVRPGTLRTVNYRQQKRCFIDDDCAHRLRAQCRKFHFTQFCKFHAADVCITWSHQISYDCVVSTCEAAVLTDDAAVVVKDVERPGWQTSLTVNAGETANVIHRVTTDLMNQFIGGHAVSASIAPSASVTATRRRRYYNHTVNYFVTSRLTSIIVFDANKSKCLAVRPASRKFFVCNDLNSFTTGCNSIVCYIMYAFSSCYIRQDG